MPMTAVYPNIACDTGDWYPSTGESPDREDGLILADRLQRWRLKRRLTKESCLLSPPCKSRPLILPGRFSIEKPHPANPFDTAKGAWKDEVGKWLGRIAPGSWSAPQKKPLDCRTQAAGE
jgi:hypothetical protein